LGNLGSLLTNPLVGKPLLNPSPISIPENPMPPINFNPQKDPPLKVKKVRNPSF